MKDEISVEYGGFINNAHTLMAKVASDSESTSTSKGPVELYTT